MQRLILVGWLAASVILLLAAVALAYMSLMMGAVHWDWWLSVGLGVGFLALALGAAWMCRRAYRAVKAAK